jgi:isopenicillin-N N-acyltransferase like protein
MPAEKKRKYLRRFLYILSGLIILILILVITFKVMTRISPPDVPDINTEDFKRERVAENAFKIGDNWVRKSKSGLWEMYLSGSPYELGIKNGRLNKELISYQEKAFIDQIKVIIPSENYLRFLKYAIAWFDKDLDKFVPLENQQEIYGISQSADSGFGFIGNNYERILNYHAAHDIGHAMQNLNLVACTSFGVWDEYSSDSSLIIGRNFDFYVGDEFAENKIVAFYHPQTGYDFAMITWAGMTGVVSGMNIQGLTITLNAAKSDIPFGARTPVSIVARHILQYASDIDEAFKIATLMKSFVCETFLIGSAHDGYAALIEKTPDTTLLFKSPGHFIIATNHLQHRDFESQAENLENMKNETSVYRYKRVEELIQEFQKFDYRDVSSLLRDQKGLGGKSIGMGNEKVINQLIAHHSVIFKPDKRLMWVSTTPFQLGEYVCYDLNKIFHEAPEFHFEGEIITDSLTISPDDFLYSPEFVNYTEFKKEVQQIRKNPDQLTYKDIDRFVSLNPDYYYSYELAGDYWVQSEDKDKSAYFYNFALSKEVSSATECTRIINKLSKLKSDTRHRASQ